MKFDVSGLSYQEIEQLLERVAGGAVAFQKFGSHVILNFPAGMTT